jgi:hypothetical protein
VGGAAASVWRRGGPAPVEFVAGRQLAFALDALGSLANSLWQLERDERAFGRAQTAIRDRLHGAATASGRRALTSADLT